MIDDDWARQTAKELVTVDEDALAFLNHLVFIEEDYWYGGHRFYYRQKKYIREILDNDSVAVEVKKKYQWLAQFHDWSLRHTAKVLKKSGEMSQDDVWSFPSLLISNDPPQLEFRSLLLTDRAFRGLSNDDGDDDDNTTDWVKEWPISGDYDDGGV